MPVLSTVFWFCDLSDQRVDRATNERGRTYIYFSTCSFGLLPFPFIVFALLFSLPPRIMVTWGLSYREISSRKFRSLEFLGICIKKRRPSVTICEILLQKYTRYISGKLNNFTFGKKQAKLEDSKIARKKMELWGKALR